MSPTGDDVTPTEAMTNVIGESRHRPLPTVARRRQAAAMALALPAPPTPILRMGAPVGSGVVVRVGHRERLGGFARLATPGALAYSCVFSLVQLGLVIEYPGHPEDARWAVLATACYLPFHLHHVRWVARGLHPPAAGWTFAALAAVVTAAVPFAGINWLPVFAVVAVSAVLVLPWPWSLLIACGVAVAQAPLALAIGSPLPGAAIYYAHTVWWRASALVVPIWLLGAIRQLQATREALAEDAVVRERLRLDAELRRTVGTALESIAARGRLTVELVDQDPGTAGSELRELVDGSRRTLAEARQLISRYQQPSLAAELETAVALLTEAGIRTRIELPPQGLPPTAGRGVRAALRTATADVLHDDAVRACVISVTCQAGGVHVSVRPCEATGSGGEVPA